jgi:UDP-N-acetylmuramate dehydrogenase
MIDIKTNHSLREYTTFKIGGPAVAFADIFSYEDLQEYILYAKKNNLPLLPLGGGSNMLVDDVGVFAAVAHLSNTGIEQIEEDNNSVILKVASGESWDDIVAYAVENKWWGIENLSHIPGSMGAFAVQNVGAYGQEASQVIVSVEAYDLKENTVVTIPGEECRFGYRRSIFNTVEKGRYVIFFTSIRLSKIPKPLITYPDLKKRFESTEPTLVEIRKAVTEIRDTKFPYPDGPVNGSAGSFFKNNVLSVEEYGELEKHFEKNMPESLPRLREIRNKFSESTEVKIPSAFILEACGLKGFETGGVMLHIAQPVVILNASGEATAREVLSLIQQARERVFELTGLHLYTEPELVGFTAQDLERYGFRAEEISRYVS